MFKTQNFCHIASNNRNNVKAGVFVYKTNDNLQTVSASGYFNPRIIDINLHDLIIHEYIDPTDNTKVLRNVLCVTVKTLDNIETTVIKSNWQGDIEQEIADLRTYVDNNFVKTDGTSTMTGPLLMRATESFKCAVAPYWDGVGFFKLNDNDSVTLMASIEYNSGFEPATTNTYNIGASARKWKNLYLAGTAYLSTINNGADISVPTTSGTMALTSDIAIKSSEAEITSPIQNQVLKYNGSKWVNETVQDLDNVITNCITEIPQNINLTLSSDGTLTAPVGVKYYFPNGADTFDLLTLTVERTITQTTDGTYLLFINNPAFLNLIGINTCVSGTTDSKAGQTWHVWYDTTNNVIHRYGADATTPVYDFSLPIGLVTVSGGKITSIDQVFNDFGYIGSTVFALPGVKCMSPNGRNADGTLKNIAFEISSVKTTTSGVTANYTVALNNSGILLDSFASYSEQENYNSGLSRNYAFVGSLTNTSGVISNFNIKTPFHAVDYNDFADLKSNTYTKSEVDTIASGKADTNLNNVSAGIDFVVESQEPTAENDYTWYRKYKSGWVEQGGIVTTDNSDNVKVQIVLPIAMADGNYNVDILPLEQYTAWPGWYMGNGALRTTTGFEFWKQYANKFSWGVRGKTA